ncbi:MAG: hypothetical protein IKA64_02010 [Clostridia bacterium]|nr:hypothetical protein [Clostridia bacterium]
MLKIRTEKGITEVRDLEREGRSFFYSSFVEAMENFKAEYTLACAMGKRTTTKLPNEMHPVRSLMPPLVKKTVTFVFLGEERV